MPPRELTTELMILVVKEDRILPISTENCSEASKEGKTDLIWVIKSMLCADWYIEKASFIRRGVKNHNGKKIIVIIKKRIKIIDIILIFMCLLSQS